MKWGYFTKQLSHLAALGLVLIAQACLSPTLKGRNSSSTASTVTIPTNAIIVSANPIVIGAFTVTVTLGSPMTGLTLSDFVVTNGTSSAFTTVSATTYTFSVTPTTVGNVTISAPAAAATVTTSGVASLASNLLNVNYDPSCTVNFTTTGSAFNGNIITTGGTTTWNMNGAITSGTNTMSVNWGVPGTRSNSVRVDTGVNFTQIANFASQSITQVSFTLGCNGLAHVYLYYNPLTSIDVTMLPALSILYIGNSGGGPAANVARIPSFDFSRNPLLTQVYLDYNNMSSLDFSQNPLINTIYARDTGTLSSINVAGRTALTTLAVGGGLLSNIDVSTNPALTALYVQFNNLSTLDVTQNPNLVTLHAASNYLTSLNISNNTLLQGLYLGNMGSGAGACTNRIGSLNFTTNNQIRYVEADCNLMTSLDFSGKTTLLTLLVQDAPNLTSVNLSGASSMTSAQIHRSPVSTLTLSGNTALTTLSCMGGCNLGTFNGTQAPNLTWLDVAGANLTSITLTANTALQTLYIGRVGLGAANNNAITSLNLTGNPNLVNLFFDNNPITTLDVSNKTSLVTLQGYPCYSLTSLNTTGATALQNLTLYGNQVPALALTTNTALRTLDTSYNTVMTTLNVSANTSMITIGAIGATALTSVNVTGLTQLTQLQIQSSPVTTLTMGSNSSLNLMNFATNPTGMNNLVGAVYAQRAVIPAGATLNVVGGGVPGGATLTNLNTLAAAPYNWVVSHD